MVITFIAPVLSAIQTIIKIREEFKNKVSSSEIIQRIYQKLDIEPINPPKDFNEAYIRSLVEFGIEKPEPILDLFSLLSLNSCSKLAGIWR